jgi:hypothetical protein
MIQEPVMRTLAAGLVAALLLSGAAQARTPDAYFTSLSETSPRSTFTDLNETAPHSTFDDLNDTAPRSPFDDLQESAPRSSHTDGASPNDLVGE